MRKALRFFILFNLVAFSLYAQQSGQRNLFTDGWEFFKDDVANAQTASFNDVSSPGLKPSSLSIKSVK